MFQEEKHNLISSTEQLEALSERERANPPEWEGGASPLESEYLKMGGEPCITPPLNSEIHISDDYKVLCCGIDSLYLTMDIHWHNNDFRDSLEDLKREAQIEGNQTVGVIGYGEKEWTFKVLPQGQGGYTYILKSEDYVVKLGSKDAGGSMPNCFIEISSITLWQLGEEEAVNRIIRILNTQAIKISGIKVSRVDLALDIEVPEEIFSMDTLSKTKSRAGKRSIYSDGETVEGFTLGKGDIMLRIYDKPKEIRDKGSKGKSWMMEVWGQEGPRAGKRIMRVEFQLRRPIMKSFMVDGPESLFERKNGIWAYLTQAWVQFLENPKTHNREEQKTLPWWQSVQKGFNGAGVPIERVRHFAEKLERDAIVKRGWNQCVNLMAAEIAQTKLDENWSWNLDDALKILIRHCDQMHLTDEDFNREVKKKINDYKRQDNEIVPF